MTFAIITHVPHIMHDGSYYAYAPYVNEMNIWLKYTGKVIIVAPLQKDEITPILKQYEHSNIVFVAIPNFNITNLKDAIATLFKVPVVIAKICSAMRRTNHIHLRCPGNVGLLGTLVQIFFPFKIKTAKYAGNWDPKAKQPWSYQLQKRILSNTFLTKNMQVLVYGKWEGMTRNIKPFFTATYFDSDKADSYVKDSSGTIRLIFAGSLSTGKQPLYAVQLAEALINKKYPITLELYGEGNERNNLETYITEKKLSAFVSLKGNQHSDTLKKDYQQSHFVILPSKSEGWPKAIAEGMFWGCVPVATKVSCVPYMLDYGQRGIVLSMDIVTDVEQLEALLLDPEALEAKREKAIAWSRTFTLDVFEAEIKKLMQA